MTKFLALIKRDLTDNKGSLIITPIVIAAVILGFALIGMLSGSVKFHSDGGFNGYFGPDSARHATIETDDGKKYEIQRGPDGRMTYDDGTGPKPVDGQINNEDKKEVSQVLGVATGFGSYLPIGVALVSIYFLLASSLYDERKDRSIMFWKSLPVSDMQTVGAKLVSIIGGGLAVSIACALVMHICLILITIIAQSLFGFQAIDIPTVFGAMFTVWPLVLTVIFALVLWAMPIYAWFLAVSAYAPKAPFLAAVLPVALLPLVAKISINSAYPIFVEPLAHMTGVPVLRALKEGLQNTNNLHGNADVIEVLHAPETWQPLWATFQDPSLWIGLVIAGGLIYAASEIRRRHAL